MKALKRTLTDDDYACQNLLSYLNAFDFRKPAHEQDFRLLLRKYEYERIEAVLIWALAQSRVPPADWLSPGDLDWVPPGQIDWWVMLKDSGDFLLHFDTIAEQYDRWKVAAEEHFKPGPDTVNSQ